MVNEGKEKEKEVMMNELIGMGFDKGIVLNALSKTNYQKENALNFILNSNEPISTAIVPYGPVPNPAVAGVKSDEDDIRKAIAMSLEESASKFHVPERQVGVPVGLKSQGNIGFFNSLLQFYNSIPVFKKTIESQNLQGQMDEKDPRKKKLFKLLLEISSLFQLLDSSNLKFEDPIGVLNAFSDLDGGQLVNTEKNHVADFSIKFITRVEEALYALKNIDKEEVPQRKDSVSFLTDESMLSGALFGTFFQTLRAKEVDGAKVRKETSKILFGKIDVEVGDKELYEAWGSSFKKKVDFLLSDGSTVKATQNIWIETLPTVLIFEINRVITDEAGRTTKVKMPFAFPDVLYPGRFFIKHCKKSSKLQRSMTEKKRQVRQLDSSIGKFLKFNNSNLNLVTMLNLCSNFLHSQGNESESFERSDIKVFTPSNLIPTEDLPKAADLIGNYSNKVAETVRTMEEKLEKCKSEIESTFDLEELKEHVYDLTGIIVHDGEVGSGQYYIYISSEGIWRKYHDMNVIEVNKKQVMFDSLGEYGISAACCLIYSIRNR